MTTIILFIIILSLLVFVHEWGHFFSARKFGMNVYEFGFGFPPRAIGWYKDPATGKWVRVIGKGKGSLKETVGGDERIEEFPSTLYSINWLPLGGFVKIKGESGERASEPDSFAAQKAWRRLVVLVAGVFMNFVLAGVLLGIGFMVGLPADFSADQESHAIVVEEPVVFVQQVVDDSAAKEMGVSFGDKIVSINGQIVTTSVAASEYIAAHNTEELVLHIDRAGTLLDIAVTPHVLDGEGPPILGVSLGDAGIIRFPWYIAMFKGFEAAFFGLITIVVSFYLLIKNLLLGQGLLFDVSGPVGIASIVGASARLGISYLINVTAMLSLSLAVINILPIPALDGGRALFVVLEKIFGKTFSMKYEQAAHTIGFVLLMILIVVVTWRDVVRLF